MSKTCQVCGRKALVGNRRSHSNIATKRKQHLNLQKTVQQGKKVKACAKCIRTSSKK